MALNSTTRIPMPTDLSLPKARFAADASPPRTGALLLGFSDSRGRMAIKSATTLNPPVPTGPKHIGTP